MVLEEELEKQNSEFDKLSSNITASAEESQAQLEKESLVSFSVNYPEDQNDKHAANQVSNS